METLKEIGRPKKQTPKPGPATHPISNIGHFAISSNFKFANKTGLLAEKLLDLS
ncbi:MAG: hypothetical protein ACLQAH_00080 [Limisphaerales bacterium]